MMVENMRHHGIDVFATINNQPYADYFSPYVFLSYLTSLGGRWINMFSLALPTILLAAYTTAITYKIGAKIKPEMGAYAVIFTFLAYEYLNICRQFSIDMPVAAATVTIIYSLGENRWKAMLLIPLSFFCICDARAFRADYERRGFRRMVADETRMEEFYIVGSNGRNMFWNLRIGYGFSYFLQRWS